MSYILGIDYGSKYIGLALSDKKGIYSKPYLVKSNDKFFLTFINELMEEYSIDTIVIGNPLDQDGRDSKFSLEVKKFISQFEDRKKCILWNETLTSHDSQSFLSKKRKRIDDIAASMILQEYLDFMNRL